MHDWYNGFVGHEIPREVRDVRPDRGRSSRPGAPAPAAVAPTAGAVPGWAAGPRTRRGRQPGGERRPGGPGHAADVAGLPPRPGRQPEAHRPGLGGARGDPVREDRRAEIV